MEMESQNLERKEMVKDGKWFEARKANFRRESQKFHCQR